MNVSAWSCLNLEYQVAPITTQPVLFFFNLNWARSEIIYRYICLLP